MSTRGVGFSLLQAVQRNADGIAVRTLTDDGQRIVSEASSLACLSAGAHVCCRTASPLTQLAYRLVVHVTFAVGVTGTTPRLTLFLFCTFYSGEADELG